MPIIVSQNGKNATKLDKLSFGLENRLQEYIYDNPESIPLYDIKDDVQLLILAREFATNSGPIDAVGIDRDGEIYLVETKLYKNPDKRTVVAQVLDYGASLWKAHTDFDDFLLRLSSHAQKQFGQAVTDKIREYYSLDDESLEGLFERLKHNLNEGNFKFVVLMDSLHDQLKDLILYMNQNSKFDIYGVELEYYQHDSFEIMIPRLFGAEVKKDVDSGKSTASQALSDEEFVQAFDPKVQDIVQKLLELSRQVSNGIMGIEGLTAKKSPKNLNFYFTPASDEHNSLAVSVGVNYGQPGKTLDFWCNNPARQEEILRAISTVIRIEGDQLPPGAKYGIVAKWDLTKVDTEKILEMFRQLANFN
ncbi:MAG: hypothetical protein V1487_01335 [bacterium]